MDGTKPALPLSRNLSQRGSISPCKPRCGTAEGCAPTKFKGESTMSDQQYTAQSQNYPLSGKKQDIITKYLADMIGVEGHIYQAIDKQVKETQDEPDVN